MVEKINNQIFEIHDSNNLFENTVKRPYKRLKETPNNLDNLNEQKIRLSVIEATSNSLIFNIGRYKDNNTPIPHFDMSNVPDKSLFKPYITPIDEESYNETFTLFNLSEFLVGNETIKPKLFIDANLYKTESYRTNFDRGINELLLFTVLNNMLMFGYGFEEKTGQYNVPIEINLDCNHMIVSCFGIPNPESIRHKQYYYEIIEYYYHSMNLTAEYKFANKFGELEYVKFPIPPNEQINGFIPKEKILTPEYFNSRKAI